MVYWRCLCEYLKSKGEESEVLLEQMLPEPAIYADYLLRYTAFTNKSLATKIAYFFKVKNISFMQLFPFSKAKVVLEQCFWFVLLNFFFF